MVYQDETGFSRASIQKKSWSSKGDNIRIDQGNLMIGNITAIASVSAKRGLVYLKI